MARARDGRAEGGLEPVGPLLRRLLQRLGLARRLEEQRAIELWPEVVGPAIADQTRAAGIREGVMFVDVASNVWLQELGLLRDGILERLNARLGAPLVHKIVLSIERPPLPEDDGPAAWEREDDERHGD
jgi:predicted nucleic acid-binding Zn ribbon protein